MLVKFWKVTLWWLEVVLWTLVGCVKVKEDISSPWEKSWTLESESGWHNMGCGGSRKVCNKIEDIMKKELKIRQYKRGKRSLKRSILWKSLMTERKWKRREIIHVKDIVKKKRDNNLKIKYQKYDYRKINIKTNVGNINKIINSL